MHKVVTNAITLGRVHYCRPLVFLVLTKGLLSAHSPLQDLGTHITGFMSPTSGALAPHRLHLGRRDLEHENLDVFAAHELALI